MLLCFQTCRLACPSFMDARGGCETPGSEMEGCVLPTARASVRVCAFLRQFLETQLPRDTAEGARGCLHTQSLASRKLGEPRSFIMDSLPSALEDNEISVSHGCKKICLLPQRETLSLYCKAVHCTNILEKIV